MIGVKVWVFKGEVLEHDPMALDKRLAGESGPAGEVVRIIECAPKSKTKTWEVLPSGGATQA